MTFQMTFAIITPALIVGAFAERMKFSALLLFMARLVHRRLCCRLRTWCGAATAR